MCIRDMFVIAIILSLCKACFEFSSKSLSLFIFVPTYLYPVSYTHLMKDYILENRDIIGQREILQLSRESANNRIEINKINSDMRCV